MQRKMIFPVLLGLVGAAILAALGTWQVQRLAWKEGILAELDARMAARPVAIPDAPSHATDNYRRVQVRGTLDGPELHVLVTRKPDGPSFRILRGLDSPVQGRILIDLGTVPENQKSAARKGGDVLIEGNLIWPDATDRFTPEPDVDGNIWFARDVNKMAEVLGTRPIMVVASATDPALAPRPWPVGVNIPNDHLQYAITWFSLMVIWLGMTGYLLWRIKRGNTDGQDGAGS